jgi:DNA-binding XRE family transcriptional regulator
LSSLYISSRLFYQDLITKDRLWVAKRQEETYVGGMAEPKGPEIEAMRKRRGWKRSELAKRVGCSYQHIYNLERGFKDGTEELLQRIANEFDVEVEAVMKPKVVAA